ncbi:uncharacterized protein LOC107627646 [Arachis ipaensis]|uniref:uncharacterized protein LOC107627646 n=1 Tax=Arachis ipaensis TaxID=130454 RepID=UPI0007AF6A01|nr:uncharacterized protein LOC107627646 [Arachis ipaensis]
MEDVFQDENDDDVESTTIADDSDDKLAKREPGVPVEFEARDTQDTRGLAEFQVGHQFQDKEEAVLSMKTYIIRCGVEYKALEFDYRKYHGKCKESSNECTWFIRISLRQRRSIWEIKQYNGLHTFLATSISSDHRRLDYHVISAFILPIIRANVAVSIKVLQNATDAHFSFRLTYRRVCMAKQKVVAQIYRDWEESYNELSRWLLGVQMTMPGTAVVLRTSHVQLAGPVDEEQAYFHRLFWTFSPCIEDFQHCKPLGENVELWSFFLSHLRQYVTPQQGILVISDRYNGIKPALQAPDGCWLPPNAYRAFCIRHVVANFALSFRGNDAWRFLMNTVYVKIEVEFDY